ncbi:MAG: SpoIIE family protein phosphatase [Blastocatellia bacterium]|nr:SpoIIE family protein phosphatase [Blastocatellia bacterium]
MSGGKAIARHAAFELSTETKLRLMMELARKVSLSLDLKSVLNLILDTTKSFIHYDCAGIYIIERKGRGQHLTAYASRGYDQNVDIKPKIGDGIVGWSVKTGFATIVPDVRFDSRYILAHKNTRSEMVVPIRIDGKVIGAFNLESDATHAYSKLELEMLMFFASQSAVSIEKALLHEALLEKNRLEAELAIASRVQQSLLPKANPLFGIFEIAGFNRPSAKVGGDHFDFIPISENRMGVVIADVAGKGVPAALVMASFRASLRAQLCDECSISRAFAKLNNLLRETKIDDQYVTAFYLDLHKDRYEIKYLNAGHNPPIAIHSDGSYEKIENANLVLGLLPNRQYQEYCYNSSPGDIIILYTDGITEATRSGEEFGIERLVKTASTLQHLTAKELTDAIYYKVMEYTSNSQLDDDCTIVVIKVAENV